MCFLFLYAKLRDGDFIHHEENVIQLLALKIVYFFFTESIILIGLILLLLIGDETVLFSLSYVGFTRYGFSHYVFNRMMKQKTFIS